MADTTPTPYMQLPVPIPTITPGPTWAFSLNSCMDLIDSHDHSPGKGVQVTPAGINIDADLSFNDTFNATNVRTVRFYSLIGTLAGPPDIGCVYVVGNELFYNDTSNNQVQITLNGSVNAGPGSITGLPSGTASAAYIALTGTFQWQQATNTAANMDNATITLRYPGSYPTPAGNYIAIAAPTALASGFFLYLPVSIPGAIQCMTLAPATNGGQVSSISFDDVPTHFTSVGADIVAQKFSTTGTGYIASTLTAAQCSTIVGKVLDGTVTQRMLYTRALQVSPTGAGNVGITTPGTYTNIALSGEAQIPNQTLTLTTTGRPVVVQLVNTSVGGVGTSILLGPKGILRCYFDATIIGIIGDGTVGVGATASVLAGSFVVSGTPGTHTFKLTVASVSGSETVSVLNVAMIVYEIN